MENTEKTENASPAMAITERMKLDLRQTAKWAKFLAVLGFIGLGFMLVLAFLMMAGLSVFETLTSGKPLVSILMGFLYLALCLIYLFPMLYLNRFANSTRLAVLNENETAMGDALMNQRKMFTYLGVMMIVVLSLYALTALIWIPIAYFTVV